MNIILWTKHTSMTLLIAPFVACTNANKYVVTYLALLFVGIMVVCMSADKSQDKYLLEIENMTVHGMFF